MSSSAVPIPGYQGRYRITRDGRVWSEPHGRHTLSKAGKPFVRRFPGKWLTPWTNNHGYPQVTLGGRQGERYLVHRLVALVFVPGFRPGLEVDHLDQDPGNPHADNLEWVTHAENIKRSHASSTRAAWGSL